MVYNRIKEEPVMGYDYHTPLEITQILLKYPESHYVKVIGRLIKYEEIGLSDKHCRKIEPTHLPSAESGNIFLLVSGRKQEPVEKLHRGIM